VLILIVVIYFFQVNHDVINWCVHLSAVLLKKTVLKSQGFGLGWKFEIHRDLLGGRQEIPRDWPG
jgi:hypothetical protein